MAESSAHVIIRGNYPIDMTQLYIANLTKVNAGVSGQTFVYLLKIALYLYEYVTT